MNQTFEQKHWLSPLNQHLFPIRFIFTFCLDKSAAFSRFSISFCERLYKEVNELIKDFGIAFFHAQSQINTMISHLNYPPLFLIVLLDLNEFFLTSFPNAVSIKQSSYHFSNVHRYYLIKINMSTL